MIKKFLIYTLLLAITTLLLAFTYRHKIKRKLKSLIGYTVKRAHSNPSNCLDCSNLFTDNVKTHNLAFLNDGLEPQNKDVDLDKLYKLGKLKKLESNSLYTIKRLDYSKPYMLPNAKLFIEDLARKTKKNANQML